MMDLFLDSCSKTYYVWFSGHMRLMIASYSYSICIPSSVWLMNQIATAREMVAQERMRLSYSHYINHLPCIFKIAGWLFTLDPDTAHCILVLLLPLIASTHSVDSKSLPLTCWKEHLDILLSLWMLPSVWSNWEPLMIHMGTDPEVVQWNSGVVPSSTFLPIGATLISFAVDNQWIHNNNC